MSTSPIVKSAAVLAVVVLSASLFADQSTGRQSNDKRLRVWSKGKYGYIDARGDWKIAATYDEASSFREGLAAVAVASGRRKPYRDSFNSPDCWEAVLNWGYVQPDGNVSIQPKFEAAWAFSGGLAAVAVAGKWGYINPAGDLVIAATYTEASAFSEGLAAVQMNGGWAYIDAMGRRIGPQQLREAGAFHQGRALVREENWYGFIDKSGKRLFETPYDEVGEFRSGRALVGSGRDYSSRRYGFIDEDGRLISGLTYEGAKPFSAGLAAVKVGGKWGFIDTAGAVVVNPLYDDYFESSGQSTWLTPFTNGLLRVKRAGLYGFLDAKGQMRIDPQFDWAGDFVGGLARVRRAYVVQSLDDGGLMERWQYVDSRGTPRLSGPYGRADDFDDGIARVETVLGHDQLIDTEGRVIFQFDEDYPQGRGPFGNCRFQHAPPSYYWGSVRIQSNPEGANVFLIPLWDWETSFRSRRPGDSALQAFRVVEGATPVQARVRAQVYIAVLQAGKRYAEQRVAIAPGRENGITLKIE